MTWLFLLILAVMTAISFKKSARQVDTAFGMVCILLLTGALALFFTRASVDLVMAVASKTIRASESALDVRHSDNSVFSDVGIEVPSLGGAVVRTLLGFPFCIAAVVMLIRALFLGSEDSRAGSVKARSVIAVISTLLAVGLAAVAVFKVISMKDTLAQLAIGSGGTLYIIFLFCIICPPLLWLWVMALGMSVIYFAGLLLLPITLLGICGGFFMLTVLCGLSATVKAYKGSSAAKTKYIAPILLSFVSVANLAVYHSLKKNMNN